MDEMLRWERMKIVSGKIWVVNEVSPALINDTEEDTGVSSSYSTERNRQTFHHVNTQIRKFKLAEENEETKQWKIRRLGNLGARIQERVDGVQGYPGCEGLGR